MENKNNDNNGNTDRLRRWVNVETGQVIDNVARIYTDRQLEIIKLKSEAEVFRSYDRRHFIQSYHDAIKEASRELSLIEAGCILKLVPYMELNNNGRLVKNGKPLKKADVERILSRGRAATIDIIGKLEELGILRVDRTGRSHTYYISSKYHVYGKGGSKEAFTKILKVEAAPAIKRLTLSEAGLLYKLIPYVHFYQYMICKNPDSGPMDKLEPLTREELAELLGLSEQTISELMRGLKKQKAIATFSTGRSNNYYVNPTILFRAHESEHFNTVMRMFGNAKR